MTAIVAIAWDGAALLAADSAVTIDGVVMRDREPKIARRDGYLVGAAGSGAFCNAVMLGLGLSYGGDGLIDWAHRVFVPALRVVLDSPRGDDGREVGQALIVAPGELVYVDDDGGATSVADGYYAIGSGGAVALGALYASRRRSSRVARARSALRAAVRHGDGVRGPCRYVATDGSFGPL